MAGKYKEITLIYSIHLGANTPLKQIWRFYFSSWPLSAAPPRVLCPDPPSCGAPTGLQGLAGSPPDSPQMSPVSSSPHWIRHERRWNGLLAVPESNPTFHLETVKKTHFNKLNLLLSAKDSQSVLSTCFILQDEVIFICLLERIRGNDYLLIQHLMKFWTNWPTQQNLWHKKYSLSEMGLLWCKIIVICHREFLNLAL